MDSKIWSGVQSLLDDYAGVRADDAVIILYTTDSSESAAWVTVALELRKISVKRVWMAPIRDEGFLERLEPALPAPDQLTGRLIIFSFERDTMSHTRTLAAALRRYERSRYATYRAISASPELFASALSVPPNDLTARNTAVLERVMSASKLRVKTNGGSDLVISIDSKRHRWISNRGESRPGGVVILPAGEVATFPAAVDGIFVADFAFNVNAITERDVRLEQHPITVRVEGGRAVKYECADSSTTKFLEECFQTHCAYNVGELGFGTNLAVVDAIPMNSHINERRPGIHLGFGQHNQDPGIVGYQCKIHLDLIARGGLVWIDDDPIPLDLEHIAPSYQPHPLTPRDEDVFSAESEEVELNDCCGILTCDNVDDRMRLPAM